MFVLFMKETIGSIFSYNYIESTSRTGTQNQFVFQLHNYDVMNRADFTTMAN